MRFSLYVRLLVAAVLFSIGAPVFAMLIGNLKVMSYMGEPLNLRIAVSADDEAALHDDCFRLVGPSSHRTPLAGARLDVVSIDGKSYVNVVTRTPVDDPFLDLSLRTEGCGATIQKDFVVLLSPMEVAVETGPAVLPPPAAAPAPVAAPRATAKQAPKTSLRQRVVRVHRTKHRRAAAKHHRKPARARSNFVLRLDYRYAAFGQNAEQVAKREQPSRSNAASKQPPPNEAAPPPAREGLTAKAEQGDRLIVESGERNAAAPAQAGGNAGAEAGSPPQGTGASVPGTGGGRLAPNGVAASTAPGAISGLPGPEPWYKRFAAYFYIVPLATILIVLVSVLLMQRSRATGSLERVMTQLHTFSADEAEHAERYPFLTNNLPPVERSPAKPKEVDSLLGEPYVPDAKPSRPLPEEPAALESFEPKAAQMGDFTLDHFDSTDQILELAEVMLAFGRSKQAIETLSEFIRSNPNQAVEPWLKLLDLYYQSGLREEFEALASDLHKRFNVAIAEWKDFEPLAAGIPHGGASLTLESLPHIMDRLTSTWGSPECAAYLDKLLADNRGGQRHGFSLQLVRDILLLRDILRHTTHIPHTVH